MWTGATTLKGAPALKIKTRGTTDNVRNLLLEMFKAYYAELVRLHQSEGGQPVPKAVQTQLLVVLKSKIIVYGPWTDPGDKHNTRSWSGAALDLSEFARALDEAGLGAQTLASLQARLMRVYEAFKRGSCKCAVRTPYGDYSSFCPGVSRSPQTPASGEQRLPVSEDPIAAQRRRSCC